MNKNLKRLLRYSLIIMLQLFMLASNLLLAKVVHIRVSEANDVGIKIAIFPGDTLNNLSQNFELPEIIKVVAEDLEYSGQFKALQLTPEMLHTAKDQVQAIKANSIDFRFWRSLGIEYILTLRLYPSSDANQLIVKLVLIDLYKPVEPIVLDPEFLKLPNQSIRSLAHKISDLVFHKLTGIRSIFKTKIAYIRAKGLGTVPEYSLNIADFDGHNEKILLTATYPLMSPTWSPDGHKIGFVSFKGNRSSIKVADLETKRIVTVVQYPGINGAPAWSPNGEELAMVLSKDGNPAIYVLNIATGRLERLTRGSMAIDTEPYWSADGKEIYFTSNRSGKPQIYKVSIVNGKIDKVTFNGDYNATPNITKDHKYLVTLHCLENCNRSDANFNIAIQGLATEKIKILTKNGTEDSPSLAPNGMMIIYSTRVVRSNNSNNRVLAVVSLEGGFSKYLPIICNGNGSLKDPAWSPFLD